MKNGKIKFLKKLMDQENLLYIFKYEVRNNKTLTKLINLGHVNFNYRILEMKFISL